MATIKFINSKGNLKRIIDYVTKEEKTDKTLISGKDCMSSNALLEMEMVKNLYNKKDGRTYLHIIQSFDPKDELTHHKANEIGLKLANEFESYQVLVVTHKDRNHIHNHLVVNSVSFEDGRKLHQSKHDLQRIKDYSVKLCLENDLSIITQKTQTSDIKQAEYQQALKGSSWKFQLMNNIDYAMQVSSNKADFITNMNDLGYNVNWTDTRKYITYTTPEGKKCRDIKLHDPKYMKEEMENEFRRIEAEKSVKYSATYELPTFRGNLRKDSHDIGGNRSTENSRATKMLNQQGEHTSNFDGTSERNRQTVGRDREKTQNQSSRSSSRGQNVASKGFGDRVSSRNSILYNSLLLANSLGGEDKPRHLGYKNSELSKDAKKEYAKNKKVKGLIGKMKMNGNDA